ncbi:MAG: amidase, partial [Dysgonamonadaceae bacterium]
MEEPLINVGILLEQPKITFSLLVPYQFNDTEIPAGDYIVEYTDGAILFNGTKHKEITFKTKHLHTHSFEIKDVIIGLH